MLIKKTIFCFLIIVPVTNSHALDWKLVWEDSGKLDWKENWFLEGDKALVENTDQGMVFTAGPNLHEHASHAVLWTQKAFSGDLKIEYEYTRLDSNMDAGVNILYLLTTGNEATGHPQDIYESRSTRREPWMKYYFLHMNSLHISYATDGRYVAARRYPAQDLDSFQKGTQLNPRYENIELFQPGETWKITVIKQDSRLHFTAKRGGQIHQFEWESDEIASVLNGRIGFRHMWTRSSRYENIRVSQKGVSGHPDIITIILDDAGWKDVGYHGGDIATPAIDKLAAGGVRLKNFYAYSTCTPSRAAFFTGQSPSRSRIVYPIQHDDAYGIPEEVETLPEVLQKAGYRTALVGKWHLGAQEAFTPQKHGFDYHYGLRGGWVDHYTRENPEIGYDWFINNNLAPKEEGHITDLITREAIRYISSADPKKPYFLCISHTAPHVPIQVDPKWSDPHADRYPSRTRQGYAGMMAQLDDSIRQIVELLEEQQQLENTLIVFFSDNGPSAPGKKWYIPDDFHKIHYFGNDGEYGDTGNLRGWKASPYNGGTKVPAFLVWPQTLSGQDWNQPVIVQDLYHSILGLAGIESPTTGRNIFSKTENIPELFYWRTPRNLALMHDGWKLVLHSSSPNDLNIKPELYQISKDVTETQDIAESHPEIVERLMKLLKKEFAQDPPPQINKNLLDK
ncbi:MAG: DUF1961 family protein [Verrucomicrobiota bacterium]